MRVPKWDTDAAPPEYQSKGLVILAGAIKYWWLYVCDTCSLTYMEEQVCTCGGTTSALWGGPEHTEYVKWRQTVNDLLIAEKYLVYRPHEAFKGTWTEDAQVVNDCVIRASKAMLVLSPPNIPTEGTDAEVEIAHSVGVPVIYGPPGTDLLNLLKAIEVEILGAELDGQSVSEYMDSTLDLMNDLKRLN